ncbi:helix-turn-helix domain-containing protein [Paenibacillus sp. PAMC21692]|uniref:helix-turn-helix domain-containing protein n=1 Tax=Paenibacillus sp. PAMC21692 TaxID=2762320 RepID=UPI00164DE413|nr:helix-turn-helix domain-containing protein [Paenibacillus sp. PAMC21692]QNK57001.1 AraC family transcriptional regulator [Paenibacillus sp. PAMC21692]
MIRLPGYLRRLLGFSLLIGLLPVVLLGGFSYSKWSSDVQEKVYEADLQLLQQTQLTVEQMLKTLQHSGVRFANSSLVNTNIDKPLTFHDFSLIEDIQMDLTALSGIQMEMFKPQLISISQNWVVAPDGLSSVSDAMGEDELDYLVNRPENSYWVSGADQLADSEPDEVSLIIKIPLNLNMPSGLLMVRTSSSDINRLILKNAQPGNVMVLDEHNRVLAAADEEAIGTLWNSSLSLDERFAKDVSSGSMESKIDGDMSAISFIKSGYNGWTYLSVTPIKEITKESRVIGWFALIMSLSVLAVTALISSIVSFRMYRPVRGLYELTASMVGLPDTAKRETDEFGFIGDRINQLSWNESRLTEQLNRQIEPLSDFFMVKLLQGEIRASEMKDRLNMLGRTDLWKNVGVLAVQIDTLEGTPYKERDRDLMLFAIKNIISELSSSNDTLRTILSGQTVVVVLGGNQANKELFKNEVYSRTEKLQQAVKQYLRLKVSCGISRMYGSLADLPLAYKESIEALKYRVKLGFESILFIEDLESREGRPIYPEHLEGRLLDAIKQTDAEQARMLLDEWIEEIFNSEMRLDEYQVSLVRLLIQIMRAAQDSGESLRIMDLESKSIIDKLFELSTKEEIRQWFTQSVLEPIIRLIDERRNEKYRSIAAEVIHMIHEEYTTDLTLESCASRLQYHPSYIWRVLRKEAGVNFSDYLSQHRLKIAKQWLEETDITITEIAERLRYNNSQNFIRYFKKMEGTSPGKYRAKFRQT